MRMDGSAAPVSCSRCTAGCCLLATGVRIALVCLLALALAACGSKSKVRTSGPGVDRPYTVNGRTYYPMASAEGYEATGMASWYGPGFHGKSTSSGEPFNQNDLTAAHTILPFQSMIEVTNLSNGRSVVVRINDRGPFANDRIIDLSRGAAERIGLIGPGTARVHLRHVGSTSPAQRPVVSEERAPVQGRFFIQVGAFGEQGNARKAMRQSNSFGLRAQVSRTSTGLWRVLYGPVDSLDRVNDMLWRVRGRFPNAFVTSDDD